MEESDRTKQSVVVVFLRFAWPHQNEALERTTETKASDEFTPAGGSSL